MSALLASTPFLIAAVCTAQTLTQLGAFTFAALLPTLLPRIGHQPYGGGFVGPLGLGILLDHPRGETVVNWGLAVAHVAVIMAVGLLALRILRPRDLPDDRPSDRRAA